MRTEWAFSFGQRACLSYREYSALSWKFRRNPIRNRTIGVFLWTKTLFQNHFKYITVPFALSKNIAC